MDIYRVCFKPINQDLKIGVDIRSGVSRSQTKFVTIYFSYTDDTPTSAAFTGHVKKRTDIITIIWYYWLDFKHVSCLKDLNYYLVCRSVSNSFWGRCLGLRGDELCCNHLIRCLGLQRDVFFLLEMVENGTIATSNTDNTCALASATCSIIVL